MLLKERLKPYFSLSDGINRKDFWIAFIASGVLASYITGDSIVKVYSISSWFLDRLVDLQYMYLGEMRSQDENYNFSLYIFYFFNERITSGYFTLHYLPIYMCRLYFLSLVYRRLKYLKMDLRLSALAIFPFVSIIPIAAFGIATRKESLISIFQFFMGLQKEIILKFGLQKWIKRYFYLSESINRKDFWIAIIFSNAIISYIVIFSDHLIWPNLGYMKNLSSFLEFSLAKILVNFIFPYYKFGEWIFYSKGWSGYMIISNVIPLFIILLYYWSLTFRRLKYLKIDLRLSVISFIPFIAPLFIIFVGLFTRSAGRKIKLNFSKKFIMENVMQYWGIVYPAFVAILLYFVYLIYVYLTNPHASDFQKALREMFGNQLEVISLEDCGNTLVDLPSAALYNVKEGSDAVQCIVSYNILPADAVLLKNYVPKITKSIVTVSKGKDGVWHFAGVSY